VTGPRQTAVPDHVARWEQLRCQYPQASYATDGGWFYGALRDDDTPLKASSLERLITALLGRQEGR
jgi:hypothetical protein